MRPFRLLFPLPVPVELQERATAKLDARQFASCVPTDTDKLGPYCNDDLHSICMPALPTSLAVQGYGTRICFRIRL